MVKEEGLEKAWERHRTVHEHLKSGLEKLGFKYLVEEKYRLPQLNSIYIPEKFLSEEAKYRKTLLEKYDIEIGAGLGVLAGKIWRIGLMGTSCTMENVNKLLEALNAIMTE